MDVRYRGIGASIISGEIMTTLERVIPIVAKQLGRNPSEFSEATNLEEAGYESLDVIETIFALEEEFNIDIDYNANVDDTITLSTIADIVAIVDRTLAKQGKA
jgi:acyl carrier protein